MSTVVVASIGIVVMGVLFFVHRLEKLKPSGQQVGLRAGVGHNHF